jgi:AcrR family transcriptional regulator
MSDKFQEHSLRQPRVGRPRRGTEAAREDNLLSAATRVFLRDGYGAASIKRIAREAGVSTRTIYQRYKNKGDLLAAVIIRLVDRDMESGLASHELASLEPAPALHSIGRIGVTRMCDPESAALIRILAKDAQRYPDLAAKMRDGAKTRIHDAIADYFRLRVCLGNLQLPDPNRAAALFMQMACGELHECLLFSPETVLAERDFAWHLTLVVDLFLNGALPRNP